MTLPVPTEMTAVVGNILTAAQWNSNVRDGVNFLANPPLFIGYQSAAQSIPNSAFTAISLDTEVADTYGGHSTTTNNSRYVAQVAGWYLGIGQVALAGNASGLRSPALYVNGAAALPQMQAEIAPNGGSTTIVQAVGITYLNVGDYIEVRIDQTSGGALNTVANVSFLAALWVHA